MGDLATTSFWEDTYLSAYSLPARPSPDSPFERCLMRALETDAAAGPGDRILEVGCAPARWMVFYAERFGATVEGVEYTARGANQSRANLEACGVEGLVHMADLRDFRPARPYDLVLSLGVIEHFSDVDHAFGLHARLVAEGGRLVLGVPNFQGINRVLQRWFDPVWLSLHNLDAMGDRRYVGRARARGLRLRTARYVGGFDADVISTRRRGRKFLAPFWRLRYRGHGDGLNAWWLSSYLLMVFDRPRVPTAVKRETLWNRSPTDAR